MRILQTLLFSLFMLSSFAQVRHGFSAATGLLVSRYRSQISEGKSYFSITPFQGQADYQRSGENTIWAGGGLGFCVRQVPFYRYTDRQSTGLQAVEYWGRLKAGLKFQGQYQAFLPFIALGFGRFAHVESYNKNGVQVFTYTNLDDAKKLVQPVYPFVEAGADIYRGDLSVDKQNFFCRITMRFYPVSVFTEPYQFEFEPFQFKELQYRIMEWNLSFGMQLNWER